MRQLERPKAGPMTGNGLDPPLQGISRCRHTALTPQHTRARLHTHLQTHLLTTHRCTRYTQIQRFILHLKDTSHRDTSLTSYRETLHKATKMHIASHRYITVALHRETNTKHTDTSYTDTHRYITDTNRCMTQIYRDLKDTHTGTRYIYTSTDADTH